MLEDWLDNPESKDGFRETIMKILGEKHPTELIESFNQGTEQEMTTTLEPGTKYEANIIGFVESYE